MAKMIPVTVHPDVRSGGERRIFALMRDAPGTDTWICLHSLGLARHPYKRRAEIDFLLISGKGVFVLEVKAGRVARTEGEWTYTDRYGQQNRKRESPFDQASSAMFALEKEIKRKRSLETKFEGDGCSKPVSDELLIQSVIDKMVFSFNPNLLLGEP